MIRRFWQIGFTLQIRICQVPHRRRQPVIVELGNMLPVALRVDYERTNETLVRFLVNQTIRVCSIVDVDPLALQRFVHSIQPQPIAFTWLV